jgi:hypothetical protein
MSRGGATLNVRAAERVSLSSKGLADGKRIIMDDGTPQLRFWDTETLKETGRLIGGAAVHPFLSWVPMGPSQILVGMRVAFRAAAFLLHPMEIEATRSMPPNTSASSPQPSGMYFISGRVARGGVQSGGRAL